MDFMASKGIEYLMVIGYLALSIPFWLLLERWTRPAGAPVPAWIGDPVAAMRGWFAVPDGPSYHRGHTWAAAVAAGRFRVGVDDFARRLLGTPDELDLPPVGARLAEGETGFRFRLDGRSVDLLSPVGGRVVALNRDAMADPGRVTDDPYGAGWLLEVEAPPSTLRNLLPARLARSWMEEAAAALSGRMSAELGPVLQDGGVPVPGFARELSPERWPEIAAELLLTGPVAAAVPVSSDHPSS
jgi:glycine cleavage system H lipoate-binding protein